MGAEERGVEELYRDLFDRIRDLYYRVARDGAIELISPSCERVLGYTAEEALGRDMADLYVDPSQRPALVRELVERGALEREIALRHKNGAVVWLDVNAHCVRDGAGRIVAIEGIARDVTGRRRSEEALAASEARYRMLVENAPLGVLAIDTAGHIVEVNPRLLEMLGSPSAEATKQINLLTFPPLVEAGIAADVGRCLATGESVVSEHPYRSAWGVESCLRYHVRAIRDVRGGIAGALAIVEDILPARRAEEDKRRLEEQLWQSQKMEALGQLAGGVAHDMNNLLGTILGWASMLQLELADDAELASPLAAILDACKAGRRLTRDLLGFARRGKVMHEPIALNAFAAELQLLLERTVPKKIALRTDLDPEIARIEGDPTQLKQALMNLCLNAVDAIAASGSVTIATRNVTLEAAAGELPAGRYVKVEVIDDGAGMEHAAVERAFEPFFTTKPTGKGTGLGLAMVYGTVKSHGGEVKIASELGRGTTVTMLLPALVTGVTPKCASPPPIAAAARRGGTALLVDDDRGCRESCCKMLETLGYRVLTAVHGEEAVRIFADRRAEIDVVVLDLVMPVMDGAEAFERMRALAPDARILLSTGYIHEHRAEDLLGQGASGLLLKPYDLDSLARELERIRGS